MDLLLEFLKGMMIGLSIAAPVGPIAILCIKTTLAHGRRAGFATGAGAAFADTFYAIIGVFGVVLVSGLLQDYSKVIRIIGGVILVDLGARNIFAKRKPQEEAAVKPLGSKLVKDFIASFFLTLTNPATIVAFLAIFAALGVNASAHPIEATIVVAGVFTGSMLWWLALSMSVGMVRSRVTDTILHRVNVISGVMIALFGSAVLISVLYN
jgi:threonine/homoserine/homoserine lactone efflux protein